MCLVVAPAAAAASKSQLQHRETHQLRTIWRDTHTLVFFKHHPKLARTKPGREAVRFARAELRWTRRELSRTRRDLAPPAPAPAEPGWWLQAALCVHSHESSDWHNRGYFRGGLQFLVSTWQSVGGRGDPADASPNEQLYRAYLLWQQQGWSPWPNTAAACGLF